MQLNTSRSRRGRTVITFVGILMLIGSVYLSAFGQATVTLQEVKRFANEGQWYVTYQVKCSEAVEDLQVDVIRPDDTVYHSRLIKCGSTVTSPATMKFVALYKCVGETRALLDKKEPPIGIGDPATFVNPTAGAFTQTPETSTPVPTADPNVSTTTVTPTPIIATPTSTPTRTGQESFFFQWMPVVLR